MKKIYIWSILTLIIATFLPGGLCAQENASTYDAGSAIAQRETGTHVTADEARAVGLRFLNANTSQTRGAGDLQMATAYRTAQGDTAFYVFNAANGFVMVAADRCATPILGYSDEGPFNASNVPVQMQGYLQGFVEQIAYGIGHPTAADATKAQQWEQVRSTGHLTNSRANMAMGNNPANAVMANNRMTKSVMMARDSSGKMVRKEMSLNDLMNGNAEDNHIVMPTLPQSNRVSRSGGNGVAPLITAMWDQGCYYNAACPADTGGICGHVPSGCVATAMGMIMHYWGYPAQGTGTHSYTPDGYPTQTVNFGATTYDWTNMPDQLTVTSSQAEIDAVSTLLWHCGVAVDMVYGATSSSALDGGIPLAFSSYFGYCNGAYFLSKGDNAEWLAQVKASLDRNRPLLYFGTDETGLGGHAFVCDGYDASDNLHFNWGWGGNGNGYFAVDAMNMNEFQFNNDIHALFGIVPQSEFRLHYNIIEGGAEVTYEQPELGIPAYSNYPDTIVIPSQVTIDGTTYPVIAIGDKAFQCCWGLKSVTMPNTITSIGDYAFANDYQITQIGLPDSLTAIGECALMTLSISSLDLPNTLTTIGPWAFSWINWYNCELGLNDSTDYLTSITIPRSLTTIGDGLCAYAEVETVHWNADSCGFQAFGEGVFSLWAPLTIDFGANCKHLPSYVFFGNNCSSITMPDSLISIGGHSFFHSYRLKNVVLGNSVITIGDDAFDDCDSLETITIPEQVRDIGMASFAYCDALTTVYFNATNCINANQAFNYDNNLTQVIIGESVTNIPSMMFAQCHGLSSIAISNSVNTIEYAAFYCCSNLQTVYMSPLNPPVLDPMEVGVVNTFDGTHEDLVIFVPCQTYDEYCNDVNWRNFQNRFQGVNETEFQLTLIPNDTINGTVDLYRACDSMAVFYANANHGYHFSHWSNGSVMNPDTVNLISDSSIVAYFEKNQYSVEGVAAKPIMLSNFEQPESDAIWTFVNGDYPNRWYINNLDGIDNRALFISDDGGVTNHYTSLNLGGSMWENETSVFAYTPLYLYEGPLFYTFNWRSNGVQYMDYFDAVLSSDSTPPFHLDVLSNNSFELPEEVLDLKTTRNQQDGDSLWHRETNELYIPSSGFYYLVFHWDDGSNWVGDIDNNPPAAIDNIIIGSLDFIRGSFIGTETVDYLDTITLTAVPNYGYHFVCWYDGDTNIIKQVVATDNLTVAALFDYNPYQVTVSAADATMGSVSGGGTYNYLSECTITATPVEGLNFIRWNDGNKTNPRTITVTQDTSFTAIFATCANTSTVESVSANESYTWADSLYTASGIYEHTWTTAEGCDSTVSLWLTITKTQYDTTYVDVHDTTYVDVPYPVHDTTYVDVHDTTYLWQYDTTFVTLHDTTVLTLHDTTYIDVPYPVHDTITITEPLTWYSLQVLSEDMDKGVGAGSGQFPEGTDVEIAAIPIEGNRFLQWSDGSESNPRTITLNDNLTLTAMFTTVGVTDLELPSWYVYPEQGAFVVKGTGGHQVSVYDAVGKLLHRYSDAPEILRYSVPAAGSYYIQVDNGAAKKVTVVR